MCIRDRYSAFSSGYNFKMNQIKDYNWMEDSKLDDAVDRLELIINKNAKFEVEVFNPELKIGKVIVGRMDCLDNDTVWEFKCTKDLDTEHFIQLAIYALLNENMRDLRLRDIEEKIKKLKGRKREETILFKRLELEDIIVVNGKRYIIYLFPCTTIISSNSSFLNRTVSSLFLPFNFLIFSSISLNLKSLIFSFNNA